MNLCKFFQKDSYIFNIKKISIMEIGINIKRFKGLYVGIRKFEGQYFKNNDISIKTSEKE